MGTHPIFESDFDCLTDLSNQANPAVRWETPSRQRRGTPLGMRSSANLVSKEKLKNWKNQTSSTQVPRPTWQLKLTKRTHRTGPLPSPPKVPRPSRSSLSPKLLLQRKTEKRTSRRRKARAKRRATSSSSCQAFPSTSKRRRPRRERVRKPTKRKRQLNQKPKQRLKRKPKAKETRRKPKRKSQSMLLRTNQQQMKLRQRTPLLKLKLLQLLTQMPLQRKLQQLMTLPLKLLLKNPM